MKFKNKNVLGKRIYLYDDNDNMICKGVCFEIEDSFDVNKEKGQMFDKNDKLRERRNVVIVNFKVFVLDGLLYVCFCCI